MRSKKVKVIKKYAVLSIAALMFSAGVVLAQDWNDVKNDVINNVEEINIQNDITTDGTALNLGAPPVPGGIVINGNGHTVTAGTTGDPAVTPSFIVNNQPNAVTTINNTNFKNGNIVGYGGAIKNDNAVLNINGTTDDKSKFENNVTLGSGGAISNTNGGVLNLDNVSFDGNKANGAGGNQGYGGAIYNTGNVGGNVSTVTVKNSSFTNNTANNYGGAIANYIGKVDITSTQFVGNSVGSDGGAIMNRSSMTISGTASNKSVFSQNSAQTSGGAIINGLSISGNPQNAELTISNTEFNNNYSVSSGGAIYNSGNVIDSGTTYTNTLRIKEGVSFNNNGYKGAAITGAGGAITNNRKTANNGQYTDAVLIIEGKADNKVQFNNNIAANGGAIMNYGEATIDNAVFNGNGQNENVAGQKTTNGGAIYNQSMVGSAGKLVVSNTDFVNNTAGVGGAIYNMKDATLIDSNFVGNKANTEYDGGAIYAGNGSVTTIISQNKDVFIGDANSVANETDSIYLNGADAGAGKATANFAAGTGRNININALVTGSSASTSEITINKTDAGGNSFGGNVNVNGDASISNATISLHNGMLSFAHDRNLDSTNVLNLYGGTLNLLNNEFGAHQLGAQELNLLGNSNIMLDVDLQNQKMDSILDANFGTITNPGNSILNVSGMKSVTEANGDSARILFTDAPGLIGHVTNNGAGIIEAPINKYSVSQETINIGGNPGLANGEYFLFNKIGNSDSILAGPVAAQGAFLMMDNIYRQSFANMDMVSLMTPEQRMAWKMRNKYANNGYHTGVYAPNVIPEERDGFYVRPFTNFENVPLKNGPKVSNVSYGTLIGGDSDLVDLGHGWDGNFSFFGAYQGSHQTYNGVSIWQNGGSLGFVGSAYKGNFWTGVTANVGASAAEASHTFGRDQFPIFMTGAAWKSGYNWGLLSNKLIIQPNYMMSYTFVNVFDYTNGAGVKVTQDPLNAIEIVPGLRIIGNLKNGWQPYLGLSMTWNLMDQTRFYANDVALSQLSVKPYFEYGVGLQKRYGNRFTGFGQAMMRNGGRNGIAFTLGLRWALGH